MKWKDTQEEMAAEKQLLAWKSMRWEPVMPGLVVGQYREEADDVEVHMYFIYIYISIFLED